jgi:hypothetical protein
MFSSPRIGDGWPGVMLWGMRPVLVTPDQRSADPGAMPDRHTVTASPRQRASAFICVHL